MTRCEHLDSYMEKIRSGAIPASKELIRAMDYIEKKLSCPDVWIDTAKIEKAIELIERYFGFTLMDWERFIVALVHCYYRSTDTVVFSEFLIEMGRGNGKNGFISGLSWYLTTKYHGVSGYNVDIVANSEDQAKTSFDDVYEVLSDTWEKSKKFFYKSKVLIRNLNTRSYIKFNTSNANTKDGKRSACLIFDEIHEYENSDTIKVFRSGFGKRRHSRIFYITTNGYVREGVLDEKLQTADMVLNGEIPNSRLCPLLYKMDSEEEVKDPAMWVKANPSLPYLPTLQLEMDQEFQDMAHDKSVELDFYTKRMNLPRTDREFAVTEYENISATNRELPDMSGWTCTVGIDYALLYDWAAVNFHFRRGEERFDINHAWICTQSPDLWRIRAPWQDWADPKQWGGSPPLSVVDDVEISPYLLTDYISEMSKKYAVLKIALDDFRYPLIRKALLSIGYDARTEKQGGNLVIVRPSAIMKVAPVVTSCFNRQLLAWGNNPVLRWAAANTKLEPRKAKTGVDTGNFDFAKIEGKSRKNDPFMALVHSMAIEDYLDIPDISKSLSFDVIIG